MLYKGKTIEVLGEKDVFGQKIAWIRVLEDNTFLEVTHEELENEDMAYSLPFIRFIAIAAKINTGIIVQRISKKLFP